MYTYRLTKTNKIVSGIKVDKDVATGKRFIAAPGSSDSNVYLLEDGNLEYNSNILLECGLVKLQNDITLITKPDEETKHMALLSVNWCPVVTGGEILSNLGSLVSRGCVDIISTGKSRSGFTVDYGKMIYTDLFILMVKEPCVLNYTTAVTGMRNNNYTDRTSYNVICSVNNDGIMEVSIMRSEISRHRNKDTTKLGPS